jgi:hypothetical protein
VFNKKCRRCVFILEHKDIGFSRYFIFLEKFLSSVAAFGVGLGSGWFLSYTMSTFYPQFQIKRASSYDDHTYEA